MRYLLINLVLSMALTYLSGLLIIPLLRKLRVGQTILEYVSEHKQKNGTPTMGGVFFIIPLSMVFLILNGIKSRVAFLSVVIGLAFFIVGFIDDFIKIKFKKNQGLKAYQKIIFQTIIALSVGVFCYLNNITHFYIPFTNLSVNFNWFTIIFVFFIFLATTNSVNLIDGLDGLASSTTIVYFIFLSLLIFYQKGNLSNDNQQLLNLSACIVGGLLAFLVFNSSKASVFMGDAGSLALGGYVGAISIFTCNAFYILVLGFVYFITSLSVIIQVIYFKYSKGKRIFLMSPLHHHFQMKGYTESKIVYVYSLITVIIGVFCLISYV